MSDETRRTIARLIKIGLIVAGLAFIGNVAWRWWHSGSVGTDIHQSTDSTMADIKRTNESARCELRNSREHLDRAEEHIERAVDAVGQSEEAAVSLAKAEDSLKRTSELYETLKQSIAKEQKISKRRALQRTGYIITTIIALLART